MLENKTRENVSENKRRIVKNTIFLYFRMFLVMGVSLYTSRIILQTLGVEDFGIYNVVGGIVIMFTFLNGSLGGATSRYITFTLGKKDYEALNKYFNVALVNHILIALIIVFFAETIGLWFLQEKMVIPENRLFAACWVYQFSIVSCVCSIISIPYNATIIAYESMKVFAYIGIVEAIVKLIIVYMLSISLMDKLIFYALLLCLLQVGILLFYWYYCNRKFESCNFKLCKDTCIYKEMFGYVGADLLGNLSFVLQGQGLNILLNLFYGPVVNAARAIAYQVQGVVSQFSNNISIAVFPQIIKSYAEGKIKDMMILVEQSSCFTFYLMWLISLPLCLEAPYILKLWLGNYPDYTVKFLTLIIVICLIQTLKGPRTKVFHATGKIKLFSLIVGGILCAALPLAYIFLKLGMNPESVFWSSIISMTISEVASAVLLKKYVDYSIRNYLLKVHGRCLLVVILSFIIPFFIYKYTIQEGFIRLLITCVITTISISIVVFAIGIEQSIRNKLIYFIKSKLLKWKRRIRILFKVVT